MVCWASCQQRIWTNLPEGFSDSYLRRGWGDRSKGRTGYLTLWKGLRGTESDVRWCLFLPPKSLQGGRETKAWKSCAFAHLLICSLLNQTLSSPCLLSTMDTNMNMTQFLALRAYRIGRQDCEERPWDKEKLGLGFIVEYFGDDWWWCNLSNIYKRGIREHFPTFVSDFFLSFYFNSI